MGPRLSVRRGSSRRWELTAAADLKLKLTGEVTKQTASRGHGSPQVTDPDLHPQCEAFIPPFAFLLFDVSVR